jgi:phage-related protein
VETSLKPVRWIGTSKEDLSRFPLGAKRAIGYALLFAQRGDKHPSTKPLQGFGGAGVLEVVEVYAGNAYRAVYTVRFAGVVYVLHAFQKKSTQGRRTPKREFDLIRERLRRAEDDYREHQEKI